MEDRNRVATHRPKAPPRPTVAPGSARRHGPQEQLKQDRETSRRQVRERDHSHS